MKGPRALALLAALALGAQVTPGCGGDEEPRARLVVVSVWSGLDAEQLSIFGAAYDTTPTLTQLARKLPAFERVPSTAAEETPEFATLLTGLAPRDHGLLSLHEPGHVRIAADVATLAERARLSGWRTLASVSSAKFTLAGLDRGFDVWRAPSLEERRRDAREVLLSIERELADELASHEQVLLVLHFGDVRREGWRNADETDEFFEQRMRPFRGHGGPVDDAWAATDEEQSLVRRLKRRLYRQGTGPARSALEASLYGARLARMDAALRSVELVAGEAGARLEWTVLGGELRLVDAALESVFPVAEPGSSTPGVEDLAQRVRVQNTTSYEVSVGLTARGAAVERLGDDAGPATSRTAQLEGVGGVRFRPTVRGAALRLMLQGPPCKPDEVWIGKRPLSGTDLCELHPRNAFDWPEEGLEPPALELRSLGGRREQIRVNAPGEIELVLESFPPDAELLATLERQSLEVREHRYRADCVVVRGTSPIEFELPPRVPSARLGLALFVDGVRVAGGRMKYRERVFAIPGRLELGLSPGVWLDPELRGEENHGRPPADSPVLVTVDLLDPFPPQPDYRLPTRAEREFLQRVDDE